MASRRILDQLIGGVAVVGADGDADADTQLQTLAAGEERLANELDDLPRACGRVLILEIADLDDGELVAADARHRVLILNGALQARGDDAQQLIARRIAQHLVDALKAVEADVLHGHALTGLGHDGHGLADALLKARAVGQMRQRIGEGTLVGARARLVMLKRDGTQVETCRHDLALQRRRPARARIVEGERAYDPPVRPFDGARPAGAQSERQREVLEVGPQWIGSNVGNLDRLAAKCGRPARAGHGADEQCRRWRWSNAAQCSGSPDG